MAAGADKDHAHSPQTTPLPAAPVAWRSAPNDIPAADNRREIKSYFSKYQCLLGDPSQTNTSFQKKWMTYNSESELFEHIYIIDFYFKDLSFPSSFEFVFLTLGIVGMTLLFSHV